ncbi:unnamed protein product [Blepharisma stoltei]|uniref:Aspartate aminotransferase n=1 Tax=Blepharisma stoltei TaxID=1481888 RepID=A0AAU9IY91_9CILI|nr:unnamed protein product [Blepharisma stoltei]
MSGSNKFGHIQLAPPDPILGTAVAYNKDPHPNKVNLGVGAYRTNEGKPLIFQAVREAERALIEDPAVNHEYLGIDGHEGFVRLARELLLGADSPAIAEHRVASSQGISGTGSLRIGAEFLSVYLHPPCVLISEPTWGNHITIFEKVNVPVKKYPYWKLETRGIDLDGMLAALNEAPAGSVVLLHSCAHNPTGVDPTHEQWERIFEVILARDLLAFFDSAYQGFATGDLEADAWAIRSFISRGGQCLVSQSFAKNAGLYGERIGALHIVCTDSDTTERVLSQLKIVVRAMYSNPPLHGALIMAKILGDPALRENWQNELRGVAHRIIDMRRALYEGLIKLGIAGDWTHITSQIGMFSYTGLTPAQCEVMINKWHCYMLKNGRISMTGINTHNVEYVAAAIKDSLESA